MKNRIFIVFLSICLLGTNSRLAFADLNVAREVENQKVHFNSSEYQLASDAKVLLDLALSLLARMDEDYILKIVGFTDSHGDENLNQTLSVQRANEVASYFIANGINRNRILIQGMGMEQPIASNETAEGRNQNRRVEFKFIAPNTTDQNLVASNEIVVPETVKEEIIELKAEEKKQQPEVKIESQAATPINKEPIVEEEFVPIHTPVKIDQNRRDMGTMLVSEGVKRGKKFSNHVYEDRKQGDQGKAYVQISPIWMILDGAKKLGATKDDIETQMSFHGEAGWTSFLDDNYMTFVAAKAQGSILKFNANAPTLIAKDQNEFTYGGSLGIGHYFHPNLFLLLESGYGKELAYRLVKGSIDMQPDFIWHAGLAGECLFWRFSQKGDVGVDGFYQYYDFGRENLDSTESGTAYGASLFLDYDFLRLSMGYSKLSLNSKTHQFDTTQFGPNLRLYF